MTSHRSVNCVQLRKNDDIFEVYVMTSKLDRIALHFIFSIEEMILCACMCVRVHEMVLFLLKK